MVNASIARQFLKQSVADFYSILVIQLDLVSKIDILSLANTYYIEKSWKCSWWDQFKTT